MAKITVNPPDIQFGDWSTLPENGGHWDERDWGWHLPVDYDVVIDYDLLFEEITAQERVKILTELFLFNDVFKLENEKFFDEFLNFESVDKREFKAIRKFAESFSIRRTGLPKYIHSFKLYTLWFYDVIKETVRGVLSDLFFQKGTWDVNSIDKFVRNGGRHVGYTTFREFITGDYEYEKALFRLAMESSTNDRALVEEIDIAIDVDDVYDRGTCEVTDKNYGANVKFSRVFSIAPEVTVTMRSGSALNAIRPEITSVTTTGFTVSLYDVEGKLTTGTFTWLAAGY